MGRAGHAWVLHGPARSGKRTLALRLMQWILKTANDAHPDRLVLDLDRPFSVADVAKIQAFLAQKSWHQGPKVVGLFGADGLSEGASNALLKHVEEPVGDVVFLITVCRLDRLPSTLKARLWPLFLATSFKEEKASALDFFQPAPKWVLLNEPFSKTVQDLSARLHQRMREDARWTGVWMFLQHTAFEVERWRLDSLSALLAVHHRIQETLSEINRSLSL